MHPPEAGQPTENEAEAKPESTAPARIQRTALESDLLALRNDLEQALGMANDVQGQLCDKSNELAQFKVLWERTQADLRKLEQDIATLREERHRLSNQLQIAEGVRFDLNNAVAERDQLAAELTAERAAHTQTRTIGDRKVAAMRQILQQVRTTPGPALAARPPTVPQDVIEEVHATLARLATRLNGQPATPVSKPFRLSFDDDEEMDLKVEFKR